MYCSNCRNETDFVFSTIGLFKSDESELEIYESYVKLIEDLLISHITDISRYQYRYFRDIKLLEDQKAVHAFNDYMDSLIEEDDPLNSLVLRGGIISCAKCGSPASITPLQE